MKLHFRAMGSQNAAARLVSRAVGRITSPRYFKEHYVGFQSDRECFSRLRCWCGGALTVQPRSTSRISASRCFCSWSSTPALSINSCPAGPMVSDLNGPAAFRRFQTIDLEQSACCTSNVGPHPQLVQARPEDAPLLLFRRTVNLHDRPALL